MFHFWYSLTMEQLAKRTGRKLRTFRTIVTVEGEALELVYTHCSDRYTRAGGAIWNDVEYLGIGFITS